MSAQSRTIKLTPGAKAYYPNGYYKRVGYQKSEASSNARVDALGQRVRDRFNEDATSEYDHGRAAGGGLQTRTLKQLKQAHSANKGGPASQVSRQSDVFTKNKMMQQRKAAASQRQDELDAQSVITQERLRKFNDIQGTVAGNVTDEMAAADEFKQDLYEAGQGEEGCGVAQHQHQLQEEADAEREEERDEVASQMM